MIFAAEAKHKNRRASLSINSGIDAYSGPWGHEQASHLLRRSMFGPNKTQIRWAMEQGMEATLQKLFEEIPLPAPPVNSKYQGDSNVPVGSTWVNASYSGGNIGGILGYRERSLYSWIIGQAWREGVSIREKLTLFWHNHFPVAAIVDPKFNYRYIRLLWTHAWSSFRELTKAVTIDPAMLFYLNGDESTAEAPNENYARELLELFTIGKGPLVAPGDYTNYTEQDVRAIARALTGWRHFGYASQSSGAIGANFISSRHDTGTKTLSHRFGNAVIPNLGNQEYARVVDLIFEQMEVARFICRKLYKWFVYYEISEEAEVQVIEPMAQILFSNDFEIKTALMALLSSEHFYDPANTGAMIKNPLDFIMSILKPLGVTYSQELSRRYDSWYPYWGLASGMQMEYFHIPDVAGWKAYYLAPQYYRNWINASTLPHRMHLAQDLVLTGVSPFESNGNVMKINALQLVSTLDDPLDPNALIEELASLLFPKPLRESQRDALKAILLPGLPDFEWTVEYGQYLQNPGNSALASAIDTKLRALLKSMLSMPEFQLC